MTGRKTLAALAATLFVGLFAANGDAKDTTPSISIVTPKDGATVAGPKVEVVVRTHGIKIVPAGSQTKKGEGHSHILVDVPAPGARAFLSTDDPRVVHLWSTSSPILSERDSRGS